jgi:hypothetical protein
MPASIMIVARSATIGVLRSLAMADAVPYWTLIAVLQSTMALSDALAMRLYRAAVELERQQAGVERLTGELALGEVRRLGKVLALGSITGPAFEAELDTPSGSGRVRFLLTQRALEHEGLAGDRNRDDKRPASTLN